MARRRPHARTHAAPLPNQPPRAKRRRLRLEQLESRTLLAADVWVNAAWDGLGAGVDPDGAGPVFEIGVDGFATIQEGIDAVDAGGVVHIHEGTYAGTLTIGHELTLQIDGGGAVQVDADGAAAAVSVTPDGDATILGLEVSGFLDVGIAAAGAVRVEDVTLTGAVGAGVGVRVEQGVLATLIGSSLDDLATGVESAGDLVLNDNAFGGTTPNSVDVVLTATATSLTVNGGNSFTGTQYYVENHSPIAVDLTAGGASQFDEADPFRIEDRVFHTLDDPSSGLVRVLSGELFVTSPGSGTTDETIQAALDAAAAGDVVRVEAGTFVGDLVVSTADVELAGAGAGATILQGVATNPQAAWPLVTPNINILAAGVSVHGFTIRSPVVAAGEYSSGIVIDSPDVEIYGNAFVSTQGDAAPTGANDGLTNVLIQTWAGSASGKPSNVDGLWIHDNTFTGDGKGYHGVVVNPQGAAVGVGEPARVTIADNELTGAVWRGIGVERGNVLLSGNTITPGAAALHAWGGVGVAVGSLADGEVTGVTLAGNTIQGHDALLGQGFASGVRLGDGAPSLTATLEGDNQIGHNEVGIWVAAGVVSVSNAELLSNTTGVRVNADAAALLTGTGAEISGGETGVDVDGGAALVQGYNLNGNDIGVLVQNGGVADLGQPGDGVDYTGLGVSSGGNDFSAYETTADATAGAIVNLNSDGDYAAAGPQGVLGPYYDVAALGNVFSPSLTTPAQVADVIYDDRDAAGVGYVDIVSPAGLVVSLGELPAVVTSAAVDEGGSVTVNGEFTGADRAHTVTISWGDGSPDTVVELAEGVFNFSVASPATAFTDDPEGPEQTATYNVQVRVAETGGVGFVTDASLSVDVGNVAPLIPLADADGDNSINEGEAFNLLLGPVVDPGADTILAYQIDWGDGTPKQFISGDSLAVASVRSHLYQDGLANPARTITVDAMDEDGTWHAIGALEIEVHNLPPTADAFRVFDSVVNEGSTTTVYFSEPLSDPGGQDGPLHFAFDFNGNGVYGEAGEVGDGAYGGSPAMSYAVVPAQFLADDDDSPRTVNARVIDKDGGYTEYSLTIGIQNVAPTVDAGPDGTAYVNTPLDRVVTFADPGADQNWTVRIDWNGAPGFEETFSVPARTFNVKDYSSFLFGASAIGTSRTVTIQVDDNDGGVHSDSFQLTVIRNTLRVTDLSVNPSGVSVRFNRALDLGVLNLYNGFADNTFDAADLTLTGAATGPVRGSLDWDPATNTLHFLKTGGVLQADAYTLTLFSGAHTPAVTGSIAFQDVAGDDLDGNGDATPGDHYVAQFTVAAPPRTLGIPDFARGPGQAVDLTPLTTGPGTLELPIVLSDANGVYAVDFDLVYDPAVLSISAPNNNVPLGPTMPSGWNALGNFISPGVLRVSVTGTQPLSGFNLPIIDLAATVLPTAKYGDVHVLRFENLRVNEGLIDAIADRAVHKVVFVGDASDSGNYTGYDASLISRVLVGIDTGFEAYDDTDPLIIADITSDGAISGLDSSLVNREALNAAQDPLAVPEIPPVPAGTISRAVGAIDPQLSIPVGVLIDGEHVNTPVHIDVMPVEQGGVIAATFTIQYDPGVLEFQSATLGQAAPADAGWGIDYVETAPGSIVISLYGTAPAMPSGAGELTKLHFTVLGSALTPAALAIEPADTGDAGLLWTSAHGSVDLSRVAGDYNLDGRVDAADYTVWRNGLGATVTRYSSADGNGNGLVDNDDYEVWRANYGAVLPAPAQPQPAALPGASPSLAEPGIAESLFSEPATSQATEEPAADLYYLAAAALPAPVADASGLASFATSGMLPDGSAAEPWPAVAAAAHNQDQRASGSASVVSASDSPDSGQPEEIAAIDAAFTEFSDTVASAPRGRTSDYPAGYPRR